MYRLKEIGKVKTKKASEISSSRLGIGFEKLDRDAFDPEKAYDKMSEIGIKWVRIQSGWQKTEKVKGIYDFAWLDAIVDNITKRNMIPWICVCYGNALYGGMAEEVFGAVGCPPIHTEEQIEAWHNYCVALSKHYRGRVTHFEVWNEPDGIWCWKHGVSATELGNFTVKTARALRKGNPSAYIIGGALSKVNIPYLNEAFKTGMADEIDAVSFHAYNFDDRRLSPSIAALRALINRYNPSIEIIQGESGAQSRPFGHGALKDGGWTPRKQCKHMLRHLITDLGMGVKFTSYFSCMDMMEALNGKAGDKASYQDYGYFGVLGAEFDENGIATGEYPKKPSYYTLSYLASIFEGNVTETDLPILADVENAPHCGRIPGVSWGEIESYGFRLDNGSLAYAYWCPVNHMTTELESAVTFNCADLGDVSLVDPLDGTIYELPSEIMQRDEFGNIKLSLLPIKDYPLLLIFGELQ